MDLNVRDASIQRFRSYSAKPLVAVIASLGALFLTSACGGSGHAALSNLASSGRGLLNDSIPNVSGNAESVGSDSKRLMILSVEGVIKGSSPDGKYQLRTIHLQGIKAHLATSLITPTGTVTQVEYATPYGPFTLVQIAKSAAEISSTRSDRSTAALADKPTQISVASKSPYKTLATGTSSRGGSWVIASEPDSRNYLVHIDFPDSSVDADVPVAIPQGTIQTVIESLY